jgi:hypothetical protein
MAHILLAGMLTASVLFPTSAALAENELSAKYGGGLDTSLVDQTCLVDQCSLQAKACLADDPSCRKGLTCTAKCLGDNACITGCMARYGNENLDNLLKCTIEDHECIKVAILPGGADEFGQEPRSPAPTIPNFNVHSMQGNWYKVVGYNPNYDCYACQRNSFAVPSSSSSSNNNELSMNVEFSMPHLLPDGSPPPPSGVRETLVSSAAPTDFLTGSQSIGLNDYSTHETMIFDKLSSSLEHPLVMKTTGSSSQQQLVSYARTAHSEGEMFGLSKCLLIFYAPTCTHQRPLFSPTLSLSLSFLWYITEFWENWYIIGENDASSSEEFKFIYYNGKTRQNTYNGAFVYSRTKELGPESLKRVYQIAQQAGMDPKQFCRIQNGCFDQDGNKATPLFVDETTTTTTPSNSPFAPNIPFRGILASTKISELLGVEPVAARDTIQEDVGVDYYPTSPLLNPQAALPRQQARASASASRISLSQQPQRSWWYEVTIWRIHIDTLPPWTSCG